MTSIVVFYVEEGWVIRAVVVVVAVVGHEWVGVCVCMVGRRSVRRLYWVYAN